MVFNTFYNNNLASLKHVNGMSIYDIQYYE
jgi:hypothetical protein